MTDDEFELLSRLQPRPAPPDLRTRVLDAVERELAGRTTPGWERALVRGVAAAFVLAVGLTVWQQRADRAWLERCFDPPPASPGVRDLAAAVSEVTDAETGRRIARQLSSSGRANTISQARESERNALSRALADLRS